MPNSILPPEVNQALEYLFCDARVRLVPDLSAAALKTKQHKEYALWLCLRALNPKGDTCIHVEPAIQALCHVFGYSRRTIFRTLASGEGKFWHRFDGKRGSVIEIHGLKSVFLMFDTPFNNTARFIDVPAGLFGDPRARRQAIWKSIYRPKGIRANPISRAAIEDYTGTQRRTQQRRDKESRVKRTSNRIVPVDGQRQRRLPNIYHSEYEPGPKGQLRKVRRYLKAFRNDEELELKRYFSGVRAILKNKHHSDICFIPVRSNKRQIKGRMEWQPIITMVM